LRGGTTTEGFCFFSNGPTLQFEFLVRRRHFNRTGTELCRKLLHGRLFAMNEERAPCSRLLVPGNKLALVCVTGKTVDGVDAGSHRNLLAQNFDLLGPIDDASRERARSGVADEDHARFRTPKVVLEMMAYATTRRHSRSRHNDC